MCQLGTYAPCGAQHGASRVYGYGRVFSDCNMLYPLAALACLHPQEFTCVAHHERVNIYCDGCHDFLSVAPWQLNAVCLVLSTMVLCLSICLMLGSFSQSVCKESASSDVADIIPALTPRSGVKKNKKGKSPVIARS